MISPLMNEISKDYEFFDLNSFFYIGGLSYLLVYIPMAITSILFAFSKFTPSLHLLIGLTSISNFTVFFGDSIWIFYLGHITIGSCIGFAIPILYQTAKQVDTNSKSIFVVIYANILIGLGLLFGQNVSAVVLDLKFHWSFPFLITGLFFLINLMISNFSKIFVSYPQELKSLTQNLNLFHLFKSKERFKKSFLLLSQYLPGSIPWGALTVFIYPYMQELKIYSNVQITILILFLSLGMILGSILAGVIKNKDSFKPEIFILWTIVFTFCLSILLVSGFVFLIGKLDFIYLLITSFAMGIVLSFPGTMIKGLLYLDHNQEEIKSIFALENFLESLGKGLGPFVMSLLLISIDSYQIAFVFSTLFWIICIVPILIRMRMIKRLE